MSRDYSKRQAVVIIHGIGEQRPMQTLRGFVNGIVTTTNRYGQKYWNKPDRMSDSFELRRLTAPGDNRNWPTTDYFEYYWAFNMRDTKYRHVLNWFLRLLFTWPWYIPSRMRLVWWASWVLLVVAVTAALTGWITPTGENAEAFGWSVSALSLMSVALLNTIFLGYIGDAARYLSPNPDNIAQRQVIRRDGVKLIRKLHKSGKYGRIIIVGHSLGSVIAYDILRFVWDEFRNTSPTSDSIQYQNCIQAIKTLISEKSGDSQSSFARHYQDLQKQLWRAERERGSKWLVTDLVTCGSPLVHASILLASSPSDLVKRQRERELPTCPPRSQEREDSFTYHRPDSKGSGRSTGATTLLHTSAPFACVRWTNLYFDADLIGGPLSSVFGAGIRDIRVEPERKGARKRHWNWLYFLGFTPMSHCMYWKPPKACQLRKALPPKTWNAIRRLRGAMQVNDMNLVTFE